MIKFDGKFYVEDFIFQNFYLTLFFSTNLFSYRV